MPTNKDFKRLVRTRMRKTGEFYTAARAQLLRRHSPTAGTAARTPSPSATPLAAIAGLSDEAVRNATGCTWARWVKALDRVDAHTWPHSKIARHVRETYHVRDWWTQMVTVGYERIKGLRARGQRRDGGYDVSRSKVLPVPVSAAFAAFHDARTRARWLPDVALTIRRATKDKSMRITWADGTSVVVGFYTKGAAKSQVQLTHEKLPTPEAATRQKAYWSERLQALATLLAAERRVPRPRAARARA